MVTPAGLYHTLGLRTIPLRPGSKRPRVGLEKWPDLPQQHHAELENIGLALGLSGVIDIDLDDQIGRTLAARLPFLPDSARFGRRSLAGIAGHWLYRCPEPPKKSNKAKVELRSGRHYSVIPPSILDNDPLEWIVGIERLAPIDGAAIGRSVGLLRIAHDVVEHWPREGDRHSFVLALAGQLRRLGWRQDEAALVIEATCQLRPTDTGSDQHRRDAVDSTYALEEDAAFTGANTISTIAPGLGEAIDLYSHTAGLGKVVAADSARTKVILTGESSTDVAAIQNALAECEHPRIFVTPDHAKYRLPSGIPERPERWALEIGRAIQCVRRGRQGDEYPCDAPIHAWLSEVDPRLPVLRGVRGVPIVRNDGSLHASPGFDALTGYWYEGPELTVPSAPPGPTEAQESALALLGWAAGARWAEPRHALAWLAHVITVAARPAISGPVPAWLYSATEVGSGKSALAISAGIIGCRESHTLLLQRSDKETRRSLYHVADTGACVVDNYRGAIKGTGLEAAITQSSVSASPKYIGQVQVPFASVISITSMEAEVNSDMARRLVYVELGSAIGDTRRNIVREAESSWALTSHAVRLAQFAMTRPGHAIDMPGFEEWAATVGGAIKSLSGIDLRADAAPDVAEVDYEEAEREQAARWLAQTFGDRVFSAADLQVFDPLPDLFRDFSGRPLRATAIGKKLGRMKKWVKRGPRTAAGISWRVIYTTSTPEKIPNPLISFN